MSLRDDVFDAAKSAMSASVPDPSKLLASFASAFTQATRLIRVLPVSVRESIFRVT